MNFSSIIDSILSKNFSPVYLLHGEENFFIREISILFEKSVIKDENKSFDKTILYGKEVNIEDLICEAKSFPMLDDYKLIIIKQAQDLKKIENLESYINNVQRKTILVLCHNGSKVRKNSRWYKALVNNNCTIFESKSQNIKINMKTFDQLINYQKSVNANYMAITNGKKTFCFNIL